MYPLSLHFSIRLVSHKSAGLTLNIQCLLDTPSSGEERHCWIYNPVLTVWKFTAYNLTHLEQGNLLKGVTIKKMKEAVINIVLFLRLHKNKKK